MTTDYITPLSIVSSGEGYEDQHDLYSTSRRGYVEGDGERRDGEEMQTLHLEDAGGIGGGDSPPAHEIHIGGGDGEGEDVSMADIEEGHGRVE